MNLTPREKFDAFALVDRNAWLLIAPACALLYVLDSATAVTLIEWSVYALVLVGLSVIISRLIFPQINMHDLYEDVMHNASTAAGLVLMGLLIFFGLLVLGLVLWAKR